MLFRSANKGSDGAGQGTSGGKAQNTNAQTQSEGQQALVTRQVQQQGSMQETPWKRAERFVSEARQSKPKNLVSDDLWRAQEIAKQMRGDEQARMLGLIQQVCLQKNVQPRRDRRLEAQGHRPDLNPNPQSQA